MLDSHQLLTENNPLLRCLAGSKLAVKIQIGVRRRRRKSLSTIPHSIGSNLEARGLKKPLSPIPRCIKQNKAMPMHVKAAKSDPKCAMMEKSCANSRVDDMIE